MWLLGLVHLSGRTVSVPPAAGEDSVCPTGYWDSEPVSVDRLPVMASEGLARSVSLGLVQSG